MKKINDLRDYLLENYVDRDGDLYIRGLDFSDFAGDIYMDGMRVKGDLNQGWHEVEGNLYQSWHEVNGDYHSTDINVTGEITFEEPKKALKKITSEELEKLGYKFKEEVQ